MQVRTYVFFFLCSYNNFPSAYEVFYGECYSDNSMVIHVPEVDKKVLFIFILYFC